MTLFTSHQPRRPTVVRLIPPRRNVYLDYGVYDVFRRVPGAARPALRLQKNGILLLGQLVQLSEEEVRAMAAVNDDMLSRMKRHLATIDFGFDMRAPAWEREYRAFTAAISQRHVPSFS